MNFPKELTEKNQWLVWRFEQLEGDKKPRKVPYYVNGKKRSGKQGDEADLANLSSYENAINALEFGNYEGLGFASIKNDGLIAIDIDSNAEPSLAKKLVRGLNSYTEISPSGNGYHIWVQGETRTFKDNNVGIEVFCGSQFLTMTAKQVEGTPFDVNPISEKALNRLREIVKGKQDNVKPAAPTCAPEQNELQKVESALAFVSSDCGYTEWTNVAAALNKAFGLSAFGLFDYWSSKSPKYNREYTQKKYYRDVQSMQDINLATIYKMACDNGWKPPKDPNWKPEPKAQPLKAIEQPIDEDVLVEQEKSANEMELYFRCLGYDHDVFYLFQNEKRQICEMKKGDFTEAGLLTLAPAEFWETYFMSKTGINRKAAQNWLFRKCYQAGVFRPDAIRGLGAWVDNNRSVYHFGSHLLIDGKKTAIGDVASRYIYELSKPIELNTDESLSNEDGRKILQTAKMFRWTRPASAPLLCGWLMLSRLCGALKWRPHIWITGESGSGKSTIMDKFIYTLISNSAVFAQGNSTEAGIRQKLKCDALPVLFDESEQNNEREQNRVQNILAMIRQASSESGAQTLKGTISGQSLQFDIRSMFMLSSIQVNMLMQADRERITVLALKSKRQENAADQWKLLEKNLIDIGLDDTIGDRLFLRGLRMLPTILKNIEVFRIAAARHFGTVREGDQYGTMLAGCWSLCEDREATQKDAEYMLQNLEWDEHVATKESNESEKTLAAILERKIRSNVGEVTLYEVINTARNGANGDLSQDEATNLLGRHGMRLNETGVLISNNSNAITDLMKGSPFQADWRGQISRLDGVTKFDKIVRINGTPSRCIHILFATVGV